MTYELSGLGAKGLADLVMRQSDGSSQTRASDESYSILTPVSLYYLCF